MASSPKMARYMWRMQGRGSGASRSQYDRSHWSLAAESQHQAVTDVVQVSFPTTESIEPKISLFFCGTEQVVGVPGWRSYQDN